MQATAQHKYPRELKAHLNSFEEWRDFYRDHRVINNPNLLEYLVGEIQKDGFWCPFHRRHLTPEEIVLVGAPNYREGLLAAGLNSRLRAVLSELHHAVEGRAPGDLRIYAPEAVTQLALLLRGRYARFIGSEFTTDPAVMEGLFPVPFENLLALSFPDAVFDVVVINDVFEHVPDIDRSLSEICRVTKPGGRLLTTFPFNIGYYDSIIKARMNGGKIQYLVKPEYHGNPVDPNGSLVFEIPGWNILERARDAGWSSAEIVYEQSVERGIIGGGFSGIFTMVAVR
jgi:SAM-dependent methyltransferase